MNKKLSTVGVALSIIASAYAADTNTVAVVTATPEVAEQEETPWFEAGFDNDLLTAYVWRNAVVNDQAVWQPCIWFDLVRFEPFYLGASVWQNWDLTKRRSDDGVPRAMNETDFNIHLGATVWESDDEDYSVELEIGHDWMTYRQCKLMDEDGIISDTSPNSYELYVKATFNNPFVGVYGQYSQAYKPTSACHFEIGLNKEINLGEAFESENSFLNALTFAADWNLNFASGKYMTDYLYGVGKGAYVYDEESEEYYLENDANYLSNGIGGTTIKLGLTWQICEHFSLGVIAAYTGVLNKEVRDCMTADGYGTINKSLAWGGLQAKIAF